MHKQKAFTIKNPITIPALWAEVKKRLAVQCGPRGQNCLLTKAGVDEAIPTAANATEQPPSLDAGRKTECSAKHAHQHVTDTNV